MRDRSKTTRLTQVSPVRTRLLAVLLGCITATGSPSHAQAPQPSDSEESSPLPRVATESVDLLEASNAGRLSVVARGQGQDRVRLTIRNLSRQRLNVVLPAGLVAASAAGQGGGGGMQSVGLGMPSNRLGAFGQFREPGNQDGLRSVAVEPASKDASLTVPAGESLDLVIPGVCLNYGLPAPTPRDVLTLMDVDAYTADHRVGKALRNLCRYGTSQGVAQAVMWRVCSDLSFEAMASQAGKVVNEPEIALASRFVEALDEAGREPIDPASITERRVFVRIAEEGPLAAHARRLNQELEGKRLLGLPISVSTGEEMPTATTPALLINVALSTTREGESRGRITVSYAPASGQWAPLGKASLMDHASPSVLNGESLALALDRALASAFVTVKAARRSVGSTTMRVENHLPFTLANVTLRAGNSPGAPVVPFRGVGIGPARAMLLPIQAATAVIEQVELNGL